MISIVLTVATIFVVAPIIIASAAIVVVKSARRRDGSIDWWELGKNNHS